MEAIRPLIDDMQSDQQQILFRRMLTQHKGLLFKVIRSFVTEPSDQDDLLQEISIQLWRALPTYRGDAKVTTWMYKVALFAAIAWNKKEQKQSDIRVLEEQLCEHSMQNEEQEQGELEHLFSLIRQLNDIDRSITLLMLDGYSYEDIAQVLGINTSNVGVKINRIKKKLVSLSQENHHGL